MKVLITGGAGFIGSHLAEELVHQKHKVTVLDNLSSGNLKNLQLIRKKIKFIKCDISKNKNLAKLLKNVDYIFHLAGLIEVVESFNNPNKYYRVNVGGTLNLLKALRKVQVKKFIYAASASCYGNSKKIKVSENSIIETLSPYALTKWLGEMLVMQWVKTYDLRAISLRFFNIYGSRAKNSGSYSSVINVFIKQKLTKKPYTIVGDGKQTRSFVHVSDVVNAMIKAAKSKLSGEIFNIGAEKSVQIKEIATILKGKKIYIPKRFGELKYSSADIRKVKRLLKWKPKITLQTGLRQMLKKI